MFYNSRLKKIEESIEEIKNNLKRRNCSHDFSIQTVGKHFEELPEDQYWLTCDKCNSTLRYYSSKNDYIKGKIELLEEYANFLNSELQKSSGD